MAYRKMGNHNATETTSDEANSMNNSPSGVDVSRCRADMAKLLTEEIEMLHRLERELDAFGRRWEATAGIDINIDPFGALLLRKARIHSIAVRRANENSNLHSLAVQMRPALECAGQVVFFYQTLIIAPRQRMSRENAIEPYGNRLNADFYQAYRRRTKGQVSSERLREMAVQSQDEAAAACGAAKPKRQKAWCLNQADKVEILPGGQEWYRYLSEHFSHGRVEDLRALSWRGGVISNN